jgi:hypothetical protein
MCLLAMVGCGGDPPHPAETLPQCANHNPQGTLLWGDLHVHTQLSFDAWIYDVRTTPEQAYAYARGEEIGLPPLDASGEGTTRVQLERPLDFAAVTDHAEYLSEVAACTTADSPVYDLPLCLDYRAATAASIQNWGTAFVPVLPERFPEICDVIDCPGESVPIWERLIGAAEAAVDPTDACTFSSLIGYEWSATPEVSNLHRNVLFRTGVVSPIPVSTFDAPTPADLWRALDSLCVSHWGCDVLAIPHNPNQSNGHLFPLDFAGTEDASLQAHREPLLEVFQHKGDSECRNGIAAIPGAVDEACDFEKLRGPEPATDCDGQLGGGGMANLGCVHQVDFARGALLAGLEIKRELGVNPYPLGLIASTDSHNGTPGGAEEANWPGHLGLFDGTPAARLVAPALNPGGIRNNPGGLVAVWAPQNRREDVFDALRRREAYGTSGPRMTVRFFGGDLPADSCEQRDFVGMGHDKGVPMGGRLGSRDTPPTFAVSALMDPGTEANPGRALQAVQLVKGWVDDTGSHTEVVDLISEPVGGVDLDTCQPDDSGQAAMCATWTDPDWTANQDAFYYVRVLEQPVCRWSWRDCLTFDPADRPEVCEDSTVAQSIQERAWTSPIFSR